MNQTEKWKKIMEKEVKRGSFPLVFERMAFEEYSCHKISTKEKLAEVMEYLLRTGRYARYASAGAANNVYMKYDIFTHGCSMTRAKTDMERQELLLKAGIRSRHLKLDFDGGRVVAETVRCYFTVDEELLEKYKFQFQGKSTYALPFSNRYLLGLYLACEEARRCAGEPVIPCGGFTDRELDVIRLRNVRDGVMKSLLTDDLKYGDGQFYADMSSILLLDKETGENG